MKNNNIEFSNPIIKDRIEVLESSNHKLVFRTFLKAGGGQNELHYHTKINETFRVISGELNVVINDKELLLKEGNTYVILPRTNHMFFNSSDKEVIFDVEILHPKKMIIALRIFYGLTLDGKTNRDGLPNNIFHTAIGLNMMDAFSPKVPFILQKAGIASLSILGKIIGIEKSLIKKYYS